MQRLTLELELVTPCFLGGASPDQKAEWRAASVRGQLRWWFRAVAGGWFAGDLAKTHRAEELVFGSTESRSPLLVRALEPPASAHAPGTWGSPLSVTGLAERWGSSFADAGARLDLGSGTLAVHYLGFGPIQGGTIRRRFLPPRARARLLLQWRSPRSKEAVEAFDLLRGALGSWLQLGGLGARSRRGFGALRCEKAEPSDPSEAETFATLVVGSAESFQASLRGILDPVLSRAAAVTLPEWTYFSPQAQIFLGKEARPSWEEAMSDLGAWLIGFRRRYGVSSEERGPLAGRDKEWAEGRNGSTPAVQVPDRAGFGLPLPFKSGARVAWSGGKDARRASPLLLHVASFGESDFRPVLTHLPARLVPAGKKIVMRGHGMANATSIPTAEQESIVTHFLEDLEGKGLVERILP